jgi:hypothetical protein
MTWAAAAVFAQKKAPGTVQRQKHGAHSSDAQAVAQEDNPHVQFVCSAVAEPCNRTNVKQSELPWGQTRLCTAQF